MTPPSSRSPKPGSAGPGSDPYPGSGSGGSGPGRSSATRRLLFRVEDGLYELVDPGDVFHVEADGDDTLVRTRLKRPYRSTERIGQLDRRLPSPTFFRVHRSHVVNLDRVRQVRRAGRDWELVLDPPVGTVVPVVRASAAALFRTLGRGD